MIIISQIYFCQRYDGKKLILPYMQSTNEIIYYKRLLLKRYAGDYNIIELFENH